MATGYEDIDKVMQQQNTLLEQQQQKSNEIVDLGLQQTQARVDKQKAEYDTEATKAGKQLYTNYRKASNPYGATAEQLASQGLGNSGYAESTNANIYNTYQKNATSLMVETQKLKADADFEMNQAYLSADIQKAQNAMAIYQQKAQLVLQEYDMKFNREQFDFQKEQFNYQKERDAMSDQRWQQEFELSLANSKKAKGTSGNIDYSSVLGGVPEGISDNAYMYLEDLSNKDMLTAIAELTNLQNKGLVTPEERVFIESKLNANKKFSK